MSEVRYNLYLFTYLFCEIAFLLALFRNSERTHCKGKNYRMFSGEEIKSTVKSSQSHNLTIKQFWNIQKLLSKHSWKIQHYRALLAGMISVTRSFSVWWGFCFSFFFFLSWTSYDNELIVIASTSFSQLCMYNTVQRPSQYPWQLFFAKTLPVC